jgi:hypothetical protein
MTVVTHINRPECVQVLLDYEEADALIVLLFAGLQQSGLDHERKIGENLLKKLEKCRGKPS